MRVDESGRAGRRSVGPAALAIVAVLVAACGSGGPAATTSSAPVPSATAARATSFAEFRDGYCAAWSSIFRAVGNPDTGSSSDLTAALDAAIKAGDAAAIERVTGEILDELRRGRAQVAYAGGWPPASGTMAAMDRFFLAYEAWIDAYRSNASRGDTAAKEAAQAAFTEAGGIDAWHAMGEAAGPIQSARPVNEPPAACPGIPVSL
jgi:hypothetical protein